LIGILSLKDLQFHSVSHNKILSFPTETRNS
jgi:hypothetical protein